MLEWIGELNGFVRMIIGIVIILGGSFFAVVVYFYFDNKKTIYSYEKINELFRVRIVVFTKQDKDKLFKAIDNFLKIYNSMPGAKSADKLNNKLVDFLVKVNAEILDIRVEDRKIININQH